MIIISTTYPIEIGIKVVNVTVTDHNRKFHKVSFLPIKEATREDYLKQVREYGMNPDKEEMDWNQSVYFYWVQMD